MNRSPACGSGAAVGQGPDAACGSAAAGWPSSPACGSAAAGWPSSPACGPAAAGWPSSPSGRRFPRGALCTNCGADLWLLDLKSGHDAVINITLVSDFDQLRDHWVKKPLEYLTGVHISPDGDAAVFTARGEVFTLPAKSGRIVKVAGNSGVRYREARYMPDGKSIIALSTETGETEFWKYPANGVGAPEQWTHDAKVLRWEGVPSPDGRWLAHHDKDQQLWLYDTKTKQQKRIAQSMVDDFCGPHLVARQPVAGICGSRHQYLLSNQGAECEYGR